jgi:hypothetical protein
MRTPGHSRHSGHRRLRRCQHASKGESTRNGGPVESLHALKAQLMKNSQGLDETTPGM